MIWKKNPAGLVLCTIGKRSPQAKFETLSFGFCETQRNTGYTGAGERVTFNPGGDHASPGIGGFHTDFEVW